MALGFGLVDGRCRQLSGCPEPESLPDPYPSLDGCIEACRSEGYCNIDSLFFGDENAPGPLNIGDPCGELKVCIGADELGRLQRMIRRYGASSASCGDESCEGGVLCSFFRSGATYDDSLRDALCDASLLPTFEWAVCSDSAVSH